MQAERLGLRNRIEKKTAYLQELEDQVRKLVFLPFHVCNLGMNLLLHALCWWISFAMWANFCCLFIKFVGLQNLIQRNERLYSSGNAPSGGVALPFILVQVDIRQLFSCIMVSIITWINFEYAYMSEEGWPKLSFYYLQNDFLFKVLIYFDQSLTVS